MARRLARIDAYRIDPPDEDDDHRAEETEVADDQRAEREHDEWANGDWDLVPPSERPLWYRRLDDIYRRRTDGRRPE